MHVFISCGELSGERHALDVVEQLKSLQTRHHQAGTLMISALGGQLLDDAGVALWADYRQVNVMGVLEVIGRLGAILSLQRELAKRIMTEGVEVVLLVDYSGFNMRLAKGLRKRGYQGQIVYYIPPKAWAWGSGRVASLRKYVDRTLVILPFEEAFFRRGGVICDYVGNPSYWRIRQEKAAQHLKDASPLPYIALLPGSRPQELARMVPLLAEVAAQLPNHRFRVAALSQLGEGVYAPLLALGHIDVVYDQYDKVLRQANLAIVTSGTATLETALYDIPQVVVYRTSAITEAFARFVLSIKYVSLVNLILDEALVTELLQKDCTPSRILQEVNSLLPGQPGRETMLEGYGRLKERLGQHEPPVTVAKVVLGIDD